ncbi:MAG: nitroreductase family protein, partial [Clostridia bacterium]|nr:nitroreductase family protein [Clostridia bacterium]
MDTLQNLYSRRTIRNFNGKKITDDQLKEILKCAYASPIGRAKYDSVMLTVITNHDFLEKLQKATALSFGDPNARPLYNAPTLILASSLTSTPEMYNVHYSNCAIVVQNMAICATELGVGACHIWGAIRALNQNQELLAQLNLPQGFVPCCAIALGQTDEKYELREIIDNRINTQ